MRISPALHHCQTEEKSDETQNQIVHCLKDTVVLVEEDDTSLVVADVVILDGPAIVNMLKPGSSKTFKDYAQDVFLPYISMQLGKAQEWT